MTGSTDQPKTAKRAEYWRERISEQERSGLSVQGFCREQGLTEQSFYAWRKRLGKPTPVRFALVETKPAGQVSTSPSDLELVLRTGERLRIRSGVDTTLLRAVLEVLRV